MAQNLSEPPQQQQQQQPTFADGNDEYSEDNNSIDDHQSETVDELLAHEAQDLGNWADIVADEELPSLDNDVPDEQAVTPVVEQPQQPQPSQQQSSQQEKSSQPPLPTPEVVAYPYKLAIVRGCDLFVCQIPDRPPFNVLVFELPDNVTEEELYMLFGGKRAICNHMYRRDLREMILNFRKKGHLIEALLKESMLFKEKPLRLAMILIGYQVAAFHAHNKNHVEPELKMIPFRGAFDQCHEKLEDGSYEETFGEDAPLVDVAGVLSIPPPVQYKKYNENRSGDVRMSQQNYHHHQSSSSINRQRTESITSITSAKSMAMSEQGGGSQSISRQSSYQPSEKHNPRNIQTQQSIERHPPTPASPAPSTGSQKRGPPKLQTQKSNPFGDAKPVNTDKKVLNIQEKIIAEKTVEHSKNAPPVDQPQFPMGMAPGTIRIQKRPEHHHHQNPSMLPPSHNGPMQFTNSSYPQYRHAGPPPQLQQMQQQQPQQQQQPFMPCPNHLDLGDETIDVSKPPPAIHKKHEEKKPPQQRYHNKKNHNYQQIPNGFNSNNMQNSHNYTSHQSLPPAPPSRRKSSADQRAVSETIQTEKSQSAPVSHETVAISQSSPRSSPSYNSLKRPNSANSSMSFVTAHSGSEMSSAMSTELPCILDSVDSIDTTERVGEISDEHRRHSWEGRESGREGRKKEGPKKKNSFGSKHGKKGAGIKVGCAEYKTKATDTDNVSSRRSSASTPQYQSASNVFLDIDQSTEATGKASVNETLPEPEQKILTKATKNGQHAHSLPRPHTSSNEKTTNPQKVEESNKPDSKSAPTTPSSKKKNNKDRKNENKKGANAMMQNNKFHALMNTPMDA